jgi:hypothetical protein
MGSNLASFPTLAAECHDTEARSLKKLTNLESQQLSALQTLAAPGSSQVAMTTYVYGNAYHIPAGIDLLDVGCYNPNDTDVWVYILISPGGPQPGIAPTFLFRVYGHNDGYYEAMTSHFSVPSGQRWDIAVSSAEATLTWSSPVYLAIRHS